MIFIRRNEVERRHCINMPRSSEHLQRCIKTSVLTASLLICKGTPYFFFWNILAAVKQKIALQTEKKWINRLLMADKRCGDMQQLDVAKRKKQRAKIWQCGEWKFTCFNVSASLIFNFLVTFFDRCYKKSPKSVGHSITSPYRLSIALPLSNCSYIFSRTRLRCHSSDRSGQKGRQPSHTLFFILSPLN